jgi:hypothetical protein
MLKVFFLDTYRYGAHFFTYLQIPTDRFTDEHTQRPKVSTHLYTWWTPYLHNTACTHVHTVHTVHTEHINCTNSAHWMPIVTESQLRRAAESFIFLHRIYISDPVSSISRNQGTQQSISEATLGGLVHGHCAQCRQVVYTACPVSTNPVH